MSNPALTPMLIAQALEDSEDLECQPAEGWGCTLTTRQDIRPEQITVILRGTFDDHVETRVFALIDVTDETIAAA